MPRVRVRARASEVIARPVHDRRATELLRAGQYAPIVIEDPFGDQVVAMRQLRNDPLARLHDRSQIDEAQYRGGRAYQDDWEVAERGPRAIDPSKEFVDGGSMPEPLTEGQRKAVKRLTLVEAVLGRRMTGVAQAVLLRGLNCELVALENGRLGRKWVDFYATMVQEILHTLAEEYQFANGRRRSA